MTFDYPVGPRGFSGDLALSNQWEMITAPLLALALRQETSSTVYCVQQTDEWGGDVKIGNAYYDLKHNTSYYGSSDDPELRIEHGIKYRQPGCDWYAHVWLDDPTRFYLLAAPHLRRWALANLYVGKGAPFRTYHSRTSGTPFSPVAYSVLEASLPPGAARIVRAANADALASANGLLHEDVAVNSGDIDGKRV